MKTVVYLIRHANRLSGVIDEYVSNDTKQIMNEKIILSPKGEKQASQLAKLECLSNVNVIYTSHFTRTVGTAKYLAEKLNLSIKIDERFGEHIFGNYDREKYPFYVEQKHHDFDFKVHGGESLNDTRIRIARAFNEVIDINKGREIAIFSHEIALLCLLSGFCEVGYNLDNKIILSYKNSLSIPGVWTQPDGFKIIFDDDKIINIEKIEMPFAD